MYWITTLVVAIFIAEGHRSSQVYAWFFDSLVKYTSGGG